MVLPNLLKKSKGIRHGLKGTTAYARFRSSVRHTPLRRSSTILRQRFPSVLTSDSNGSGCLSFQRRLLLQRTNPFYLHVTIGRKRSLRDDKR
ncbi:hypothetical protein HRI_003122400 [Hibiscus trionum]|uniref:Uncharacterized protein n=1 Tax=Hibiscus trionum TaxID=183268 RepID=A0A9W7IFW8_HIBTR|nr:hypothetical protein HRI_003122400 [Hibiscus trionum]